MRSKLVLLWVLTIILISSQLHAQVAATAEATATTPEGKPLYQLAVSYNFEGREAVYLNGVGTLPASGKLTYLSGTKAVEFRSSATGLTLSSTTAPGRGVSLAKLSIPNLTDFPNIGQVYELTAPEDFTIRLYRVLSELGFRYAPYVVENTSYCSTDYVDLPDLPENLHGRIALRFAYPAEGKTLIRYQVSRVLQEKRSKSSDYRDAEQREVIEAGDRIIKRLVLGLATGAIQ